jgi:DNA-directed RNA polymerase subunit beta
MNKSKLSPSERRKQLKQIEEEYKEKNEKLTEQLTEASPTSCSARRSRSTWSTARPARSSSRPTARSPRRCCASWRPVYDHIEIDPSPIRNKINEIISEFKQVRGARDGA